MFDGPIRDPALRERASTIVRQLQELHDTWAHLRSMAEREQSNERVLACDVQIRRISTQIHLLNASLQMT